MNVFLSLETKCNLSDNERTFISLLIHLGKQNELNTQRVIKCELICSWHWEVLLQHIHGGWYNGFCSFKRSCASDVTYRLKTIMWCGIMRKWRTRPLQPEVCLSQELEAKSAAPITCTSLTELFVVTLQLPRFDNQDGSIKVESLWFWCIDLTTYLSNCPLWVKLQGLNRFSWNQFQKIFVQVTQCAGWFSSYNVTGVKC